MNKEFDSRSAILAGAGLVLMTILGPIFLSSVKVSLISIIGITIVILLDFIVAGALYYLFLPESKILSFFMSISRIIYGIIFAIALINISNLAKFHFIWEDIGFIFFELHLLLLGILAIRSKIIPKWIGILVIISSAGYFVDSVMNYLGYKLVISVFTFIGEVLFGIWILIKGIKEVNKNEN